MKVKTKICRYCGRKFRPDPRTASFQKACSQAKCKKARQRQNHRAWVARHPNHDSDRAQEKRVWSKVYPRYWRRYRARSPAYQDREKRRMAAKRRRERRVANQITRRKIAVEKLRKIESQGAKTVANQITMARRVDEVVQFLFWKEGVANQKNMESKPLSGQ